MNSSNRKNYVFGLILSYAYLFVSIASNFFVTPILLNYIGDSNYGLLTFCTSLTSWLSLISSALGASYLFFAAKYEKEGKELPKLNFIFLTSLLIIGCASLIVIVSILFGIKLFEFSLPNYTAEENLSIFLLLIISSAQILTTISFSFFSLFLNYKKKFIFTRGLTLIVSILTHIVNVIVAITTKSIVILALSSFALVFISNAVTMFYSIKFGKSHFKVTGKHEFLEQIRPIAKYSILLLISTIISNLDANINKILLGFVFDSTLVTTYQLSISFVTYITLFSFAFVDIMRPSYFNYCRVGDKASADSLFLDVCKTESIVVFLIVGGFIACGFDFVLTWVGESRIEIFYYTAVLFVSSLVMETKHFSQDAYRTSNKQKYLILYQFLSLVFSVIVTALLFYVLGREYAIWACVIGVSSTRILFNGIIIPILDVKIVKLPIKKFYLNFLKNFLITLIAVVPSVLIAFLLKNSTLSSFLKMIIEGCTFVVLYLLALIIFDKKYLKKLIRFIFKRDNNVNIDN